MRPLHKFLVSLFVVIIVLTVYDSHAGRQIGVRIDGTDTLCSGYTVSAESGTSVYTCNAGPVPPGAPTNCAPTVNGAAVANFPSAGGSAALAVACTQTSGVLYNWSRNGTFNAATTATWTDTLPSNGTMSPVNYSYQVRACIGAACVTVPSSPLVATVAATGSFSGSCPGYDNTITLTLNWGSPTRLFTGHMGANDMVLVQFTTGNVSTTTSLERIAAAEFNSPPSGRIATLSSTPCDFSTQTAPGSNMQGNSITASFAITPGTGFGYYAVLNKNTTYYVNIKNSPSSTCASGGECSMFVDLLKVGGT